MNQNIEIAKHLIDIGARQIIGVLGSGDSFEIVESFMLNGGEFLESPSEFSAPIIASAINKVNFNQTSAVSISIRGPGLISSLPGLYHNFIEDLPSLSISESLSINESNYNHHKTLDTEFALKSVGFCRGYESNFSKAFDSISRNKKISNNKMVHLTTRDNQIYSYSRSNNEMCSDHENYAGIRGGAKTFVFGKRGMEFMSTHNLPIPNAPHFLTPAALPFADVKSPYFLGVWTGNEQFKPYFLECNHLSESIIVRVGVMKRELLTLKINREHFDVPLSLEFMDSKSLELLSDSPAHPDSHLCYHLSSFRKEIANKAGDWSVYSAISIINDLKIDLNYSFDVGSYATIIENYILPLKTGRLHSSFIGKFMGTAVPISIGVSLAEPKVPVLCMLGEGSFASSFNEIVSIANLSLPVCLIIFSDGTMHSVVSSKIKNKQNMEKFLPSNYRALEKTKIPNLPSYIINSTKEFIDALDKWDLKSPVMLFLKFDSTSYVKGVELLR